MSDMLETVIEKIQALSELEGVVVKPYYRPEPLGDGDPSVVLVPMSPPKATDHGSDGFLRKQFTYQVNVEAASKAQTIELAKAIENLFIEMGFIQLSGGIDDYFRETGRYVDARRYRGFSSLYDTKY